MLSRTGVSRITSRNGCSSLDDVIVHGNTFNTVVSNLCWTFTRFRLYNLKLSPKRCNLFQTDIKFLRQVVSEAGISTQASKREAIVNWPTPHNCKFFRHSFTLARICENIFSSGSSPHPTDQKTGKICLGPCPKTAFLNLKSALTTAPVLVYSSQDDLFVLDCDAMHSRVGQYYNKYRMVLNGSMRILVIHLTIPDEIIAWPENNC